MTEFAFRGSDELASQHQDLCCPKSLVPTSQHSTKHHDRDTRLHTPFFGFPRLPSLYRALPQMEQRDQHAPNMAEYHDLEYLTSAARWTAE